MKTRPGLWLLLGLLSCAPAALAASAPDAEIRVDASRPGIRMSPQLWGIFFEEINFAGDGGIYAELVRNRDFEDRRDPLVGWKELRDRAEGSIAVDRDVRLNDVRRQSLRIRARTMEDGGAMGVVNEGYWGVPLREGDVYSFSLFVKAGAGAGSSLTVSLRDASLEKVYAKRRLTGVGTGWKRLSCELRPTGTDMAGKLVITAGAVGDYWIDVVSLFPPTWKDQPNGLRPDLVKLLADLKPSFFRFPGGCFAEGITLRDTFLFKESIGPIEERKGRRCFWGYRSTDGLGYYEYLRLAEDLGADPIFCINPGANNGVREVVPMRDMEPWLQTAVDAVEFAIGSSETTWGAKRAAMGHPEPFRSKVFYLQIGNETEFSYDAYVERFVAYRDRVKRAFPGDNVKIIADSWGLKHRQDVDTFAIDYHRYMSWQDAIRGRDQYDGLPRGRPWVFKGEYATRSGSGILQALSEAVYMMGLEENSDEVLLAAYAPLFANVNGTQWRPDLIYFDNHRSLGTISYYVQQMYSEHRGDRALPLELEQRRPEEVATKPLAGSIGVGSWSTQVEYRDIRVVQDGKTVFEADASGPDGWRTENGRWDISGGVVRQTSSRQTDCRAWIPAREWSKYQLHLKARKVRGAEGFLIMVHVGGREDFVWANFGGWSNRSHAVERVEGGGKTTSRQVNGRIESGRWYDVRIDVDDRRVVGYLDGRKTLDVDLGDLGGSVSDDLYATACRDDSTGEVIVRVVNIAESAKRVRLRIDGVDELASEGTAITLQAEDRGASQSLEDPLRYRPRTSAVRGVARELVHEVPACSFTILRLRPAKRS